MQILDMPSVNPSRLLALADREFRQLTNKPLTVEPTRKCKPVKPNSRGSTTREIANVSRMRLTAVLRREDDSTVAQPPGVVKPANGDVIASFATDHRCTIELPLPAPPASFHRSRMPACTPNGGLHCVLQREPG
jgi:hypothetical protein